MVDSPTTEMKQLASCGCNGHLNCSVSYNQPTCPFCDAEADLRSYRRTVSTLRQQRTKLKERVAELEERLVCTTCGGDKKIDCSCLAPKPDDGTRFLCGRCGGSQELPCPDCGEEAGS